MQIPDTAVSKEQTRLEERLLSCIRSNRPTPFKVLALQEYCALLQGARERTEAGSLTVEERFQQELAKIVEHARRPKKVLVLGSIDDWGADFRAANFSHVIRDCGLQLYQIGICSITSSNDHHDLLSPLGRKKPELLKIPGQTIYGATCESLAPFSMATRCDGLVVHFIDGGDRHGDDFGGATLPPSHAFEKLLV